MRHASTDQAIPELAPEGTRSRARRLIGWIERPGSRLALAAALGTATAGIAFWLASSGADRQDRTRAGGHMNIVRCPVHGIAYDVELEQCTECAKAVPVTMSPPRRGE